MIYFPLRLEADATRIIFIVDSESIKQFIFLSNLRQMLPELMSTLAIGSSFLSNGFD
jgi:hypothetical protein